MSPIHENKPERKSRKRNQYAPYTAEQSATAINWHATKVNDLKEPEKRP